MITRCNCENSKCTTCYGKGCDYEPDRQRAKYVGPICDRCANDMPSQYLLPPDLPECPLTFLWDEDENCWMVRHGDLAVRFFKRGQILVVTTGGTNMQISYDNITEERGMLFQPWRPK